MEVGVRELRSRLSYWLDQARSGQPVIVTDRGRPIARLAGLGDPDPLARLIEAGLVTPSTAPRTARSGKAKVRARGTVSDLVSDQRR